MRSGERDEEKWFHGYDVLKCECNTIQYNSSVKIAIASILMPFCVTEHRIDKRLVPDENEEKTKR